MIGYHAIPVITDAYIKNIRDYDEALGSEAMVNSAMQNHLGLKPTKKMDLFMLLMSQNRFQKILNIHMMTGVLQYLQTH